MAKWKKDQKIIIKAPVVLAEKEVEHLVEGREILEPSAAKITEIRAEMRNVKLEVVPLLLPEEWVGDEEEENEIEDFKVKVLISGILHKQIFWVGKRDNQIHHMKLDTPFSTYALFTERDLDELGSVPNGFKFDKKQIQAQLWDAEIETVVYDLISPNRLIETVILSLTVKLEQQNQTKVETGKKKR